MKKMIVCAFNSRLDAYAARESLIRSGFEDVSIRVAGGGTMEATVADRSAKERAIEQQGGRSVIELMFSGMFFDSDEVTRYSHAVDNGKYVVALHVADDAAADRVVSILKNLGEKKSQPIVSDDNESRTETSSIGGSKSENIFEPRIYPLPNSPTGWGDATLGERSSIGDVMNNPGRPEGLLRDAGGLGSDADRSMMRQKATPLGEGKQE